jgi:hypothetical protein
MTKRTPIVHWILVGILFALFAATAVQEAYSQQRCGPLDKVTETLKVEYDEMLIASMKDKQGVPLQIWANLNTGSWTAFYLTGSEDQTMACSLDMGTEFRVGR